jgi:riboflavin kinase/FMN adenylyltransferase
VALRPEVKLPLLLTYDEKLEILSAIGLDAVVEQPFSREFSSTSPERFFTEVILRGLNAQIIVVGYDFAFGKGREGQLERLGELCGKAGIELQIVSAQRVDGEVASSTRIRAALAAGDPALAARLLGREFFYRGVVVKGQQLGRKLGFPTANLSLAEKIALPNGVYATTARLGSTLYPSVTNVGVKPTFSAGNGELPAQVECHLLDQTLDLYGLTLEVRFHARLRDERRFSGMDELKAQIALDAQAARQLLVG